MGDWGVLRGRMRRGFAAKAGFIPHAYSRAKLVVGGWWLVVGGWWLVATLFRVGKRAAERSSPSPLAGEGRGEGDAPQGAAAFGAAAFGAAAFGAAAFGAAAFGAAAFGAAAFQVGARCPLSRGGRGEKGSLIGVGGVGGLIHLCLTPFPSLGALLRPCQPPQSFAPSLSCVRSSKSLASCRSGSWPAGSPQVRLTMRPRFTAGRSAISRAQRSTLV